MRKFFRAVLILITCTAIRTAYPDTGYLLQSESSGTPDAGSIGIRLVSGYESGYIPDIFYGLELGFGIQDWLQFAGAVSAAQFPDQGEFRFAGYEITARMQVWKGKRDDALTACIQWAQSVGDPIIIDYPGTVAGIGSVVSPRTDAGVDLSAGLSGRFSLFSGFAFLFNVEYSRTEARTWFPLYGQEAYKNRIFVNLVPALFFSDALMACIQNRLTWWGERGLMYETMPQVNWEIIPGIMASVGGSAPVVGGGVWKGFAALTFDIDTDAEFAVLNERDGIRLRVYFNFLGDKADLFAPMNPRFGDQNRRLVNKVAAFIEKYEDYTVVVEGHTNRAKFEMSFEDEQAREMLPLARSRASAVREALIKKGFDPGRISVQAYGALHPIADFKDDSNNWKNRRVEILLKKKSPTGGTKR